MGMAPTTERETAGRLTGPAPIRAINTLNLPSLSAASRRWERYGAPFVGLEARKGWPDFWRIAVDFER
jgi:hypothetical protein